MEKHVHIINQEKIKDIEILDDDANNLLALLYRMFADPTRLKILQVLQNHELNVCEIAFLLNMTHSAISHQLATLKMSKLVKSSKKGKEVYYSLDDEHVSMIISIGKEHIMEVI